MELTQIEKALYDKEAAILQAEIARGTEIIRNAVLRYGNTTTSYYGKSSSAMSVTEDEIKQLNQWFYSIGGQFYYSGKKLAINSPSVKEAPEFIRTKVLGVAVDEFMTHIGQIEAIKQLAEFTANQQIQ